MTSAGRISRTNAYAMPAIPNENARSRRKSIAFMLDSQSENHCDCAKRQDKNVRRIHCRVLVRGFGDFSPLRLCYVTSLINVNGTVEFI